MPSRNEQKPTQVIVIENATMTPSLQQDLGMVTNTLSELAYRLAESFYEENQIYLAQQRIAKLRVTIDRERQRILQWRTVLHRRKEQERYRKQHQKNPSDHADED